MFQFFKSNEIVVQKKKGGHEPKKNAADGGVDSFRNRMWFPFSVEDEQRVVDSKMETLDKNGSEDVKKKRHDHAGGEVGGEVVHSVRTARCDENNHCQECVFEQVNVLGLHGNQCADCCDKLA